MLAGFLPRAIVSAVQLAIFAAHTEAWDNAKKYIESGVTMRRVSKGSDIHKAAAVWEIWWVIL
jgi:Na+/H+-translocating membrane pyrophosphatase